MSTSPSPPPDLSPPPSHHHFRRHNLTYHLLPPLIASTVTISLLLLLLFFIWRRLFLLLYRRKPPPPAVNLPRRFSFSALRRATDSFSPSRRLGQGGFGSVFAGTLTLSSHRNLPIAVKLMDSGSLQGEREFHNEVLLAEKMAPSDRIVKLHGFASSRRRRRMCLVYELMPKGNLQDCLLHKKCEELMDWSTRLRIAVQVARGLAFLHHQCDPPIIHGDVKPSNILLDDKFCAKIGDFGLARLKITDNSNDVVVDVRTIEGEKGSIDNNKGTINFSHNLGAGVEDSGSLMETESVTTTVWFEEGSVGVDQSPMRTPLGVDTSPEMVTAMASPADFFEFEGQSGKVEVGVENNGDRDVLETHDGNENGNEKRKGKVKDYVMEWMGTKNISDRVEEQAPSSSSVAARKPDKKKGRKKFEWWVPMDEGKISKKEKRRPAREWWKEEYCEELARKKKKKKNQGGSISINDNEEDWWERDDEMYVDATKKKKKKSRAKKGSRSNLDWWLDGLSGDLWKDRNGSYDSMSGEIPKSGGISSTPSMRGTVCYIAPEYSTGGDLSEKCDVYSFGVLLLVLIAGRRPLQVSGSPMSEFHRANLLSWARHLARAGKLLDLVDQKIQSLNREQAQLCLVVALVCLQKSPARRPSMKEVAGMLIGELDPPQLPLEYTPSAASQYPFKSRKKHR